MIVETLLFILIINWISTLFKVKVNICMENNILGFLSCINIAILEISLIYEFFQISEFSAFGMWTKVLIFTSMQKACTKMLYFNWFLFLKNLSMEIEEVFHKFRGSLHCYNHSVYFIFNGIFNFWEIMWL